LDDSVCENIVCGLDEYNIGGINITVLDDFVGLKSLRVKIASFKHTRPSEPAVPVSTDTDEQINRKIRLSGGKLLVWIDDNPQNNVPYVNFARSLGIEVRELSSTALAKVWIDNNIGNCYFVASLKGRLSNFE
jgi:hypothetical protein